MVPYCRASRTVDGSDRWGLELDDVEENCIKPTYFSEETRQKCIVNALTLTFIPLKFSVSSCFFVLFICCCFFIDQIPTLGWSEQLPQVEEFKYLRFTARGDGAGDRQVDQQTCVLRVEKCYIYMNH